MEPYIGKVLNERYEIQSLIGRGSTAVVYKAHCRRLDRTVALKIINEELSSNEALLARFYDESSKVAALSQANIVDIFDINQHQNIHYIVMEYLDGISLKQFIEYKHLLTWNETIYFTIQILNALAYAHTHGVVHHNLKPQNVMVLRDGSVKVTDFAIAHLSTSQSTMTRSQLESTYYLSPEQTNGSDVDTRSDLYSLGIMMYEMLTGKVPYTGTSSVSVAVQHVQGRAVPPCDLQPNIPMGLQQITMHAMNSDIRYRYNTAYGMKKDLETLQQYPRVGFRFKKPVIQEVRAHEETRAPAARPVEEQAASEASEKIVAPELHAEFPEMEAAEGEAGTEQIPEAAAEEKTTEDTEDMAEGPAVEPQESVEDTPAEAEEHEADAEVEAAASLIQEELFNTGESDDDFALLWEQLSQQSNEVPENTDESCNETEADDEDYDDEEDEYDDDEDEERRNSIAMIIIIVLIVLIVLVLAVVGFFCRTMIAEYAVNAWNWIKKFFQNL